MPICKDCGLKGSALDREKFMQHGYPKDGQIQLSCLKCGSPNIKNTLWENLLFYIGWGILCILFSWLLIPAFIYFRFMRDYND